jgi:glutamyl-tRNA synthetase
VPAGVVRVHDALQGTRTEDVAAVVGDFVLRRGDGVFAYQLAVVVDDLAMGVTEVVRGCDLLGSAPRQTVLARLLGAAPPAFAHVPLVRSSDGGRLAKRAGGVLVRAQRERGLASSAIVGLLARTLGLLPMGTGPVTAHELLRTFDRALLAGREHVTLPAEEISSAEG